jgi:hypothetical protein
MFLPGLNRAPDFIGRFTRAHLPNELASFGQKRNEFRKIDISGKWRLVILRRPDAVLHMATKGARPNRAQPFFVIHEAKVFFDLKMTEVMPVTDLRRVQLIKKRGKLALARDFFVTAPAFDSESNVF